MQNNLFLPKSRKWNMLLAYARVMVSTLWYHRQLYMGVLPLPKKGCSTRP